MKNSVGVLFILLSLFVLSTTACKKKTDEGPFETPTDYFRTGIGKYIIYQLDSTRFANYGQDLVVTSYQIKDIVEGTTTDLLNRPSYRIQRYIRALTSTSENDWRTNITYLVTIDSARSTLEVLENNLRYVKMQGPLRFGRNWVGNGYLPDDPFSQYEFTASSGIQNWSYSVDEIAEPVEINGKVYENVMTIHQVNDSSNVPVIDRGIIGQRSKWIEQYAKDLGLVSKEVIMWEYQPEVNNADGYTTGFGIKLTILDHN